MHTLLLRLAGPLQSWGVQSRYTDRDTGLEPSKSGVVGLLCAALGRGREESTDDLAALRFGVRVDREGTMRRDFQTARDVARFDRGVRPHPVVSDRYYLADADFLVGLSGDDLAMVQRLDAALRQPVWQLCLGRKAFVPARPVALALPPQGAGGIRQDMDLIDALRAEPWRRHAGVPHRHPDPTRLRCAIEVDDPRGTERRMDQPGPGAAFAHRHFLPRFVRTDFWQLGADVEKGAPSDV